MITNQHIFTKRVVQVLVAISAMENSRSVQLASHYKSPAVLRLQRLIGIIKHRSNMKKSQYTHSITSNSAYSHDIDFRKTEVLPMLYTSYSRDLHLKNGAYNRGSPLGEAELYATSYSCKGNGYYTIPEYLTRIEYARSRGALHVHQILTDKQE